MKRLCVLGIETKGCILCVFFRKIQNQSHCFVNVPFSDHEVVVGKVNEVKPRHVFVRRLRLHRDTDEDALEFSSILTVLRISIKTFSLDRFHMLENAFSRRSAS